MRVASIQIRNFKRFTDLVIKDIPKTAKLVVVVGPNGCGKSSLFDAFLYWYRNHAGHGGDPDVEYYQKNKEQIYNWQGLVAITLHDHQQPKRGSLYVRTAYRNEADFDVRQLHQPENPTNALRISRSIFNDVTVGANYSRLVYDTVSGVYDTANDSRTVRDLREELIGSVRCSMQRVFGDLLLHNIANPLGNGSFFFEKGTAKRYHYKNLSGGEKAAFDLLLDLHIKKRFFTDSIYCIDEIETHLHTKVQGLLLKEMFNVLPETCQLWLTTHSLGVLRAAQELISRAPTEVCIIDFHGVDLDAQSVLTPANLGKVTWEKLLSIVLDDLSPRIAPQRVVVCEGSSKGTRRRNFDADIYNRILGTEHPDVVFVSGGSTSEVQAMGISIKETLSKLLPQTRICSLVDRDDKSAEEVARFEKGGDLVLPLRNLESYLLADEVVEALVHSVQKPGLLSQALTIKASALANSVTRKNAPDDLKSAAGEIYVGLKGLLGLQGCGGNTDAFMRDTLAPLITPRMQTHQQLKAAIIGRLT